MTSLRALPLRPRVHMIRISPSESNAASRAPLLPGRPPVMRITVETGDITKSEAPCIVVNLFEGVTAPGGGTGAVDAALDGQISELIADGDIRGKYGELTLHPHVRARFPRRACWSPGSARAASSRSTACATSAPASARYLRGRRIATAATITHGAGIAGLDAGGVRAGDRRGRGARAVPLQPRTRSTDDDASELEALTIVEHDAAKVDGARRRRRARASSSPRRRTSRATWRTSRRTC